jgi:hypothetical protein
MATSSTSKSSIENFLKMRRISKSYRDRKQRELCKHWRLTSAKLLCTGFTPCRVPAVHCQERLLQEMAESRRVIRTDQNR